MICNLKSFQKTVNEATGKSKSKHIGLLRDANNTEVSNDSENVDLINFYFINTGKELAENFPKPMKCQFVYRITPTIQDLEVNINKLKSDLKNLKPNKASGSDGISSRSLAVAESSASDGLLMVFYFSMALGTRLAAPFTSFPIFYIRLFFSAWLLSCLTSPLRFVLLYCTLSFFLTLSERALRECN